MLIRQRQILNSLIALILLMHATSALAGSIEPKTLRISVGPDGEQADGSSYWSSSISKDGRYIAFESEATILVEGDINAKSDIFVHDLKTNRTSRVSVGVNGIESNKQSSSPSISYDGRYIAFTSYSDNLVLNDTNNREDVFVHDRWLGTNELTSIGSDGTQSNGSPFGVTISGNGRYVFFVSEADNLIEVDTNSHVWDIFVYDRETQSTSVASLANDGTQANGYCQVPSVSADGRYVAFQSDADNLTEIETLSEWNVFVRDRQAGTTVLVSVSSNGQAGNASSWEPSISGDGRYVAFWSQASNLVEGHSLDNLYLHDMKTGETKWIGLGGYNPDISADGRYVAYRHQGPDIFLYDLSRNATTLISVTTDGQTPGYLCQWPQLSADGRYVAFTTNASNIIEGDTNEVSDIFVRGPLYPKMTAVVPVLNLLLE